MPAELKWAYIVQDNSDPCITPVSGSAIVGAKINENGNGKFILKVAQWTVEKGRLNFGAVTEVPVSWYVDGTEYDWDNGYKKFIMAWGGNAVRHDSMPDVASGTSDGHDNRYVRLNSNAVFTSIKAATVKDSSGTPKIDVDGSTLEGNWTVDGDLGVTGDLTVDGQFSMTTPEDLATYEPSDLSSAFGGYENNVSGEVYAKSENLETLRQEYNKLQAAFDDLRTKCIAFGWCQEAS